MNLEINEHVKRILTIKPDGRLDSFTAPKLRSQILEVLEEGTQFLCLDLRELLFIDSAGIAVLVNALKRSRQQGGDTKLVAPLNPEAMRMFELTKFDQIFDMGATPAEVLARF